MSTSRQLRVFFQRFVLALALAVAFTATGIGMAYWVAADKIDSAKTAKFDPDTLDEVGRGEPANFLIIGSDTRAFIDNDDRRRALRRSGGADRSALGHDHDRPHRSRRRRPACSCRSRATCGSTSRARATAKINAAFNDGPQTRRRDDQAELRHPDPPLPRGRLRRLPQHRRCDRDGPDLLPDAGTRQADRAAHRDGRAASDSTATMALDYARSREYEYIDEDGDWAADGTSDLGRIRRQQYFIRSLADEADRRRRSGTSPKINDIVNKTVDNITRDPDLGLSDILALAKTFRKVDPGVVEMVTVPTEPRVRRRPGRAGARSRPRPRRSSSDCGPSASDDGRGRCPRACPRATSTVRC